MIDKSTREMLFRKALALLDEVESLLDETQHRLERAEAESLRKAA